MQAEFNLLHEPWVRVLDVNGDSSSVSVLDVFRRAPELKDFSGELSCLDVAVLRFLLAILHAVFGRFNCDGEIDPIVGEDPNLRRKALNRWSELWDAKHFPMFVIEQYLKEYEDRFYLFHPERPFYQVKNLEKATPKEATYYDASKLNAELSESSNKTRLFRQRSGIYRNTLTYEEAARWLLFLMGFDDASLKPKSKKKEKETFSPGVAWLGKLGLVHAVGQNLFETLMLNLVLLQNGTDQVWEEGVATWELDRVRTDERHYVQIPASQVEILTLQSRRVILMSEKDGDRKVVTQYKAISGDYYHEVNALSEQMTVWKTKKKGGGVREFRPRKHSGSRQIWRDIQIFHKNGDDPRPGVVNWIDLLIAEGKILEASVFFRTNGVEYDSKNSSLQDIIGDWITFNASLLTDVGGSWLMRIADEVAYTDTLAKAAGYLAGNLAVAAGARDGNGAFKEAVEQAYFRLDLPFRKWLKSVDPHSDEIGIKSNEWEDVARRIIRQLGRELYEQSGSKAFVGRVVEVEDNKQKKKYLYASPRLFNIFMNATEKDGMGTSEKKVRG